MKQEIIRIDLNGVNCYLGKSEAGYILFDTGGHLMMDKEYTDRREMLLSRLEEAGCKPGNLKAIVITHGDSDHVANAAYLRDRYRTVIAMHGDDIRLVDDLTLDKMMESFRFRSIIYKTVFLFMKKTMNRVNEKILKDYVSFKPDVLLKDGDDLTEYGFDAKVIHIPGHTSGSIGILTESRELISGDIFANAKKPAIAPNAFDFKQLKDSIKKLRGFNISKVYPGHGEPFEAKDFKDL